VASTRKNQCIRSKFERRFLSLKFELETLWGTRLSTSECSRVNPRSSMTRASRKVALMRPKIAEFTGDAAEEFHLDG